jgi:hypothetical protein
LQLADMYTFAGERGRHPGFCDHLHTRRPRAVVILPPWHSCMEAIITHLIDKNVVESVNRVLLLGMLWSGLAACVVGALSYDIAYWFQGW